MPPPLVFMIASAAALFITGIWLRHHLSADQTTIREMRRVARRRIADVPNGELVRIVGALRVGPRTMEAPLSGRICAGYRVRVDVRGSVQDGLHEERCHDFVVEDESGRAIVKAKRLQAVLDFDREEESGQIAGPASARKRMILARHGRTSTNAFGLPTPLYCREGALVPGKTVVVVGRARWEDDPDARPEREVGGYRESARKKRLVIEAPSGGPVRVTDHYGAWSRDRGFGEPSAA